MSNRYLQIHTLTSYAGALLNRDDMGFAKRLPFGGVERTRVSSQCLKRHWRTFMGPNSLSELNEDKAIRSRRTFKDMVLDTLIEEGTPEEHATAAVSAIVERAIGKGKKNHPGETEQVTVLGEKEVEYLRKLAKTMADDLAAGHKLADVKKNHLGKPTSKNLQALIRGAGLDAALFGRMVTSDMLARVDAAIHVAHAITVHKAEVHDDYFSAVDDLASAHGETGSGHINSTQLTSGLFYGYVVVDIPGLVSNLSGGDPTSEEGKKLAGKVVRRLIELMATVSPGAKLGATAPYAAASCVLVESGDAQPRTLANAFLDAVPSTGAEAASLERITNYLRSYDEMYAPELSRVVAGLSLPSSFRDQISAAPETTSLREVALWAAARIEA